MGNVMVYGKVTEKQDENYVLVLGIELDVERYQEYEIHYLGIMGFWAIFRRILRI